MSSVESSFPPKVTLASALNSTNASVLAAKAFADPNAGYPAGLRLSAAISDNSAGRFNLASGLVIASNALTSSLNTLKDFQSSLTDIYSTVARLRNPALDDDIRKQEQQNLDNQIDDLRDKLAKSDVNGFNLLDASQSDGIQLDLNSGALTNVGKTPNLSASGTDQRFAYSPDRIAFQSTDLSKAIDDLSQLAVQTYPGTDSGSTTDSIGTVGAFKAVVDQASNSLKDLQKDLATVTADRLNVTDTSDDNSGNIDGVAARQIASRLALALHNDSFNITSSVSAKFFSLFA